ncbi:hypothetical protein [Actinomadura sp. 9N407]|uniref:hypothetical protein n=1 Tax=Actinomadura sp. 9N407 TaxID=3375154 RepID=UPI00378D9A21
MSPSDTILDAVAADTAAPPGRDPNTAPADGTAAPAGGRRFRGGNKGPVWRRPAEVTVVRLRLTPDPAARYRLERLFDAGWQLQRALKGDARARAIAYRSDCRSRIPGQAAARRRELGLSREGLERAAYRHLDASGHLKHHLSKAVAMHLADQVWTGLERHLFPDKSGRRHGLPKAGTWQGFTRLPGRARSHTIARKWETFRLHGTLAGHLTAHTAPGLLPAITPQQAAALPPGTTVLAQRRTMPTPSAPRAGGKDSGRGLWWDHAGPLVVVYAGGPAGARGDLVLPVRLPQGSAQWPHLLHVLGDPAAWHKVDLVRRAAPAEPGGWAYEAHLMVLTHPYIPASTMTRRAIAPTDRRGGVDANVSNLAAVSFPTPPSASPATARVCGVRPADPDNASPGTGPPPIAAGTAVVSSKVTLPEAEQVRLVRQEHKRRRRQRALERSRRAANTTQYEPGKRQRERDRRRQAAGLPPKQVPVPAGPRVARADGKPRRSPRSDTLSRTYRRLRARLAAADQRAAQSRATRARQTAAQIVAVHGPHLVIEDCRITGWFRLWGRACARFTPGMLTAALQDECAKTGGQLLRASTVTTALSQHCLCGRRVPKPLGVRVHECRVEDGGCGLTGDRDLTAAALAAFVHFTDPGDPSTARVDYTSSRRALGAGGPGLPGALTESTAPLPTPRPGKAGTGTGTAAAAHHPERRLDARWRAWWRAASARPTRTSTVPTPDEPPPPPPTGRAMVTPDRHRPRTRLPDRSPTHDPSGRP